MRLHAPKARLFYAASSLCFGDATESPQTESTPLAPRCVYGITKTAGVQCCRLYRQTHGLYALSGFLYNHESPLRPEKFVTQKIVRAAKAIARGEQSELILGDLSARIDWGWAPDYADAMTRTLRLPEARDFVIATGETHSVRDFVEIAFTRVGLDWQNYVKENTVLLQRRNAPLVGDASLLRQLTGWKPMVTFPEMIDLLLQNAP